MEKISVLKIYDIANREITRKRKTLLLIYALVLIAHLVISILVEYNDFLYFLIAVAMSVAYVVAIFKIGKINKIQDVIIKDDSVSVSSEDVSYTINSNDVVVIQKKGNFNVSFLLGDGTEKVIRTDRHGYVKLVSYIINNETLRSKINSRSFF